MNRLFFIQAVLLVHERLLSKYRIESRNETGSSKNNWKFPNLVWWTFQHFHWTLEKLPKLMRLMSIDMAKSSDDGEQEKNVIRNWWIEMISMKFFGEKCFIYRNSPHKSFAALFTISIIRLIDLCCFGQGMQYK